MSKQNDTKNLFNWGEISRLLSGTRCVIRKNQIPKVHQPFISDMIQAIDEVKLRHGIK